MGIGTGKANRFFALTAGLAFSSVSHIPSSEARPESRDDDSATARPASSYPQSRPPAGFASEYAEVNGFRMHYVRGGQGSPVVMIHGFPQSWAEWRQQLDTLAGTHTVIAVDLRGTGDSEVTTGGYEAAQLAGDVRQLLRRLGFDDGVRIIAHDIGVWVAYAYAAQWPSEVRSMAVMEAPVPDEDVYRFPVLNADPDKPAVWHYGLFQLPLAEHLIAGHERVFIEEMMTLYLVGNKSPFTASDYDFYAHYLKEPGRTTAWMNVYRQLRRNIQDTKEFSAHGKLEMPVLAIGGQDSLGDMVAGQWHDYAVNVQGRVLKNSGHFVTEEKPAELTALLDSFLRK